jgi:hypothetical protein
MWAKLGRCKGAARGALQVAAQRPAYSVQVPENIGCCMQRCRALQGAALQPLFIGLQRCSAAAAQATGQVPSLALWVMVPAWPILGRQQAGYLVQLGGYVPQAPILALALVPTPLPPPARVLKSARFVLRYAFSWPTTVCGAAPAADRRRIRPASLGNFPGPWLASTVRGRASLWDDSYVR